MNENTDTNNEIRTATEAQTTGIPQMAEINWADYLDQTQFKDGNSGVITVGDTGPWVLQPIPEDIFGQTRLYSGDIPDRSTQLPLSEPLYECRLGWYYSPSRTTCKRTGQPLKKKPSYRYDNQIGAQTLGRDHDYATYALDNILATRRNYVVFVPQELWSQYPNSQSYTKPHETITGEAARLVISAGYDNVDLLELGKVTVDLNSPVESPENSPVTVSPYTLPFTTGKLSLWKRFLNWLSLEY